MAWSEAARAAAAEARRLRASGVIDGREKKGRFPKYFWGGKFQSKPMPTLKDKLKSHPMYSKADYRHLSGKGYSDTKIKELWDRDHAAGGSPTQYNNMAPKRPASYDKTLKRLMSKHR